jgi:hypothetical protein
MRQRFGRAAAIAGAAALSACGGSGPGEPTPGDPYRLTLALVSPAVIRSGDPFSTLPDTIVIEARTSTGSLAPAGSLVPVSVTGWIRTLDSERWYRRGLLPTDATGHVHVIWQFSGSPTQRLAFGSDTMSLPLARPATLLTADTVVTSGPGAVCTQQGGRVGCVDDGPSDNVAGSVGPGRIRWFTLDAPLINITSNSSGACALLTDGRTACWEGRGPDRLAPSDTGHPALVELRGAVGRTSAGEVWFKYPRTGYPTGWLRMSSDSAITALLENSNENLACGRTASDVVMCGATYQSSLAPGYRVDSMRVVRDSATGVAIRASGGFTAQAFFSPSSLDRLVLRRVDGGTSGASRPSNAVPAGAWVLFDPPDAPLSGPDARIRACVVELDAVCDAANPWRSVSRAGMLSTLRGSYDAGYQRTCGVRSIIVCASRDATGRLAYLGTYQALAETIVDTIRLAP